MEEINPFQDLRDRLWWLIKLRWLAISGVLLTLLFTSRILKLSLPFGAIYTVTLAIGLYNLVFFLIQMYGNSFFNSLALKGAAMQHQQLGVASSKGWIAKESRGRVRVRGITNRLANLQISLDLASLTALIHFSGGIENPFIFYFIFHMIIASILLSRRASFFQATLAVGLFGLTVILEYFGALSHYCLKGVIINQHNNLTYLAGSFFVFMSTIYIAVYLTTSISSKLREREEKLEKTNTLLKEKDRLKSEYVLRVSHDIKEHLSAIQGCLEPVAAGITGELNPQQFDLIQRASQRTAKLMFFVKTLLEITHIKLSQELKMEYFSFKDMLSEVISHLLSKAKDKNVSISSALEPGINRIRGAREYIQETISNLLGNSIKYTPPHGKVDINISDKGNSILIQIKDTGIGIPKEDLPKIFEEFYRASNAKEVERDGTGLGLSIARQIVERHQGKIWAESEEGKGSIFSIQLPK